jgi:hypothetical protein
MCGAAGRPYRRSMPTLIFVIAIVNLIVPAVLLRPRSV